MVREWNEDELDGSQRWPAWSGVQMNAHFKLSPNPFTIDAVQPAMYLCVGHMCSWATVVWLQLVLCRAPCCFAARTPENRLFLLFRFPFFCV